MKITLTDLVNLQNETTAVNAINNNNTTLETAFENTLSRDGTTPNVMGAALDMNSNQILNLPSPASAASPLRLTDLQDLLVGVVHGGSATQLFNVKDFGATGNGSTDDAAAIRATVIACVAAGRGTVYFPAGTYACSTTAINLISTYGINFLGAGSGNNAGVSASTLMYTGASGSLIRLDGTEGITFSNISFKYNNPSYNGNLINISSQFGGVNTAFTTFRDFSAFGSGVFGATTLFYINKSLNTTFENGFMANAIAGIAGADTPASTDFCNCVYIKNIWFDAGFTSYAILGGGLSWNISDCIFEPNRGGGVCAGVYVNAIGIQGLFMSNNSFEDGVTGNWIVVNAGPIKGGTIVGNLFQGGDPQLTFNSADPSKGVVFSGNMFISGTGNPQLITITPGSCVDFTAVGNGYNLNNPGRLLFNPVPTGNSFIDNDDDAGIRITGGKFILMNLPTSAPAVTGSVWNNAGTLKVV